jgi:hypothetical protein
MIQHAEVLRLRWRDGWKPRAPVVDWKNLNKTNSCNRG